jgi:UDP-N-acetylmuramate--alanine ligase
MFTTVRHIHFVGIGGIGMSGIAEILLNQGFKVSGSDMSRSEITDYLSSLGAAISIGHDAAAIQGAEVVVYSSAVKPQENPETKAALERSIPLIRRAEMLAELSRLTYTLAIAGTHGKTTTTSLCGLVMMKAGLDPTVIVGGRLRGLGGTNARLGKGDWTVVEADEYDRSFLQLFPTIAVINNVEAEHLDIYGTEEEVQKAFLEFAGKVPFYGFAALGLDDRGIREIYSQINKKVITFGLSRQCDIRAVDIQPFERASAFNVMAYGENIGQVHLNIPGLYNVKNALAAITVGMQLDIPFGTIADALHEFAGVYRRFEIKGERDGILIIDDYAHHPTELANTLAAARAGWKDRRIVCAFQPHTYTRTRDFYKEFGRSFDDADLAFITDIYPARETPIPGITGELIAQAARKSGHRNIQYVPDPAALELEIRSQLRPGDLFLTIGAGDITRLAGRILQS